MGVYRELKEDLEGELDRLAALPEVRGALLTQLLDKLRQNRFNLVVLGAFKRGKSTLINALLGEAVLPTSIIPLTSVVTILGYGEHLEIRVLFQNGQRTVITPGELAAYITEKGNPRNHKGVREVEITYPSDYLRDGVRIIDTPGVGSVYSHNTEVAYNYLPRVDAAVFVTAVDPPLSAAEEAFLKDIREYAHKLFFVLNKIDYVAEPERQEALDFTAEVLRGALAAPRVLIFPLSAKLGLEGKADGGSAALTASLLPEFEDHLRGFLYQEKGRVLLISCINRALKTLNDSTLALTVERQASAIPLNELEEKIARFNLELQGLEKEREMSLLLLEGRVKGLVAELSRDLEAFKRETGVRLRREVEAEFQRQSRLALDLRQEMEGYLFAALRDIFLDWRVGEVEKLARSLADTQQEFAARINGILERLTQLTARIFDFPLPGFAAAETLTEKSRFGFKFKDEPVGLEILQMTVASLLPRALTKGLLLKKLLENVAELVDKHCGRLRYDFQQRLQELTRDFRKDWLSRIDDTTQGIRQALERARAQKRSSTQAAARRAGEMEQRLTEISRGEGALLGLKTRVEKSLPGSSNI